MKKNEKFLYLYMNGSYPWLSTIYELFTLSLNLKFDDPNKK